MTSTPLLRRTLATLRNAEFGFFGVDVYTFVHTPRLNGLPLRYSVLTRWRLSQVNWSAGDFDFTTGCVRPLRISWFIVGIVNKKLMIYTKNPPGLGGTTVRFDARTIALLSGYPLVRIDSPCRGRVTPLYEVARLYRIFLSLSRAILEPYTTCKEHCQICNNRRNDVGTPENKGD